ncbi:hypothetical protein ACFYW6_31190 [Streptomyces sp. NPDC002659]|uniref:hypothetical protein n=1 Tax=Streptomyces sp. NPDC002659 TaxID=3364656 RepID=UPI00369BB3DD
MVESTNARLRKTTRNRGHFPSEQTALKVLYLGVRELIEPKERDISHVAAHWMSARRAVLRRPDQRSVKTEDLHKTPTRPLSYPKQDCYARDSSGQLFAEGKTRRTPSGGRTPSGSSSPIRGRT